MKHHFKDQTEMKHYIKTLVELKRYMIITYGFTRGMVARSLVEYEQKTAERPCIIVMNKWHLSYAGLLIAKAKKDGSIISTFRSNGRYYKFTDRVNL
jgi:hypothetical protein